MIRYRSLTLKQLEEKQLTEMLVRAQSDHVVLRDAALEKDTEQLVELVQNHIYQDGKLPRNMQVGQTKYDALHIFLIGCSRLC